VFLTGDLIGTVRVLVVSYSIPNKDQGNPEMDDRDGDDDAYAKLVRRMNSPRYFISLSSVHW
jgi:hypothetical protein